MTKKILWRMLLILIALIFNSFTGPAQEYISEAVIDEDTGATAKFARSVELVPEERMEIYVSTESTLPWELKVTQIDSANKELITIYNGGGDEEKNIRKEFASPGHYAFELEPVITLDTRGFLPVDASYTPPINWHMSVIKYKLVQQTTSPTSDLYASLLQTLSNILDKIYNYLHPLLSESSNK
jgi:hypothetical protein